MKGLLAWAMVLMLLSLLRTIMGYQYMPIYPSETLNLWLSLSSKDMSSCKLPFARPVIIAEAGTAHLGSVDAATDLVDCAAEAGADVVKFQAFDKPSSSNMFCWITGDSERSPRWKESRLGPNQWWEVKKHCARAGVGLMLSCFEISTIAWAEEMRLPCMKVASRATKNFPWNEWSRHLLVSTGMFKPNVKQIAKMPDNVTFMECTAEYPAENRWLGTAPGYSSHSAGPFRAIEAIINGAAFIEVHYKDPRCDPGPDEPVSLSPSQLTTVCEARDYYYEQRVK